MGITAVQGLGTDGRARAGIYLAINIPFGTALGVYTLWALLPSQSQQEYEALVTARASGKGLRSAERLT